MNISIDLGVPQTIMVILYTINIVLTMKNHGMPREGKHNIWGALIGTGIGISLLNWGGFF